MVTNTWKDLKGQWACEVLSEQGRALWQSENTWPSEERAEEIAQEALEALRASDADEELRRMDARLPTGFNEHPDRSKYH